MAEYNKKNLANSTLAAPIDDDDTSVSVQTGEGANFPSTPFYATITPYGVISSPSNSEIVQVTNRSTDTLTITRAQRSTTAKSFLAGAVIANGFYTQDLDDLTQDDIGDGSTYKQYSSTEKTKLSGIETAADVTDAQNVGSSIYGASAKTTPVNADEFPLIDSAASNVLKKVTWSNIKATLKSYFDTLYQPLDATLTALAGLATGSNKIPYSTGTDTFGQLTLDTDGTLAANSDTTIASQKATKTYTDSKKVKGVSGRMTTSVGWNYITYETSGVYAMRIHVHSTANSSTSGETLKIGLNSTNSGTPPNYHYSNDTFWNGSGWGRDTNGATNFLGRCYSNASGNVNSVVEMYVTRNLCHFFGYTLVATGHEKMEGEVVSNFPSGDFLSQGNMAFYTPVASTLDYTIEYFYS